MSSAAPARDFSALMVPGRTCGTCSMCCKVFDVPWVDNKPKGQWCKHSRPGKGCGIWDTRPQRCQAYFCQWFFAPALGPEWRPDIAKFVLNLSSDEFWLEIIVDSAQPNAWRREPYGAVFRRVAAARMAEGKGLMLHSGSKRMIVTPTEEVDLAQFPLDARFSFSVEQGLGGVTYSIQVATPALEAAGG